MGCETANVHLGSKGAVKAILRNLEKKKASWLQSSAKEMVKATEREWNEYAKSG